jgi:UDP-N-acetylmuramoyl-tripeptide--D-alanyl-D-alanine ligase
MTIFGLSEKDEVMVLEMGMNHLGEIRRLSQIAAPDIAVITNIGTAHIGNLGSRENIFRAKKEIFEGMASGSQAILCGDDDFLPRIAVEPALLARHRIFYAGKGDICSYRVVDARVEVGSVDSNAFAAEMSTVCTIRMPDGRANLQVRIPAAGMHLIYPASIAAGVGDLLGMTPEEIREGIEAFTGQRMACEKYGDILLFDDTYNASLDSMKSSLQVLACLPAQKKAAVLGDMLEQGDFAQQLHREVGAAAARAGLDTLITVGELSKDMADEARRRGLLDVRSYPDRESAAQAVEEITVPGTALLFKASHSMALDKLAAICRKKAESLIR